MTQHCLALTAHGNIMSKTWGILRLVAEETDSTTPGSLQKECYNLLTAPFGKRN